MESVRTCSVSCFVTFPNLEGELCSVGTRWSLAPQRHQFLYHLKITGVNYPKAFKTTVRISERQKVFK